MNPQQSGEMCWSDRLGCPDPTMAEETTIDKTTELMKKKTDERYEEEKECKKYTKSYNKQLDKEEATKKLQKAANKQIRHPNKDFKSMSIDELEE